MGVEGVRTCSRTCSINWIYTEEHLVRDLVIKKADKGSWIVVQDSSTYVAEGKSHLGDSSTYKPLDADPTASIAKAIG